MKTFLTILLVLCSYKWYSTDKELTKLQNNAEIHFFLTYSVIEVENCTIDGCTVKVKRNGELLAKPLKVTTFDKLKVPTDTKVYRTCTGNLKERTVVCSIDAKLIDAVEPKYTRHPDWDLRPVADKVTYE